MSTTFVINEFILMLPKWWNWYTRHTQNVVSVRRCGFESHLRYKQRTRDGVVPLKPESLMLDKLIRKDELRSIEIEYILCQADNPRGNSLVLLGGVIII